LHILRELSSSIEKVHVMDGFSGILTKQIQHHVRWKVHI
jgi:hypothetical protein